MILKKYKNNNNLISIIQDIHVQKKDRKGCFEQKCLIKKKWIKNIVFYER